MHYHHHCPTTNVNNAVVVACIAGAATSNTNTQEKEPSCNPFCTFCGYLRYLLVFFGLLGCAMDYMLRFNISVAIIAMVNNSETYSINSTYACPAALNASRDAQISTGAGDYDWSEKEQGLILGTFFYGYVITKTIGGRIAEILGPAFTVTLSLGLCGVLSLLTPTVADVHPLALAALRLLMGLLQGPIFPAIYCIISRWTLPGETATMISVTMSGLGLGALMALGLSGVVIKSFGWRWVFWGSGILTLAWLSFWVMYVWDYPRRHPGISKKELTLLSKNQNQPRKRVPWSRIYKSRFIYLFMMMEFANVWIQTIVTTEGPSYLTTQVGMGLQEAGNLNIILMAMSQVMCVVYGWLSDLLERRGWDMLAVRRLFQGFGVLVTVGGCVGLSIAGCDEVQVAVYLFLMVLGLPVNVIVYSVGPMIIAPNYAGTLSGLLGVGTISGFVLPIFVSFFVGKKNGWMTIFLVSAALNLVAGIVYIIWMPSKEVEWNMYEEIPGADQVAPEKRKKETIVTKP